MLRRRGRLSALVLGLLAAAAVLWVATEHGDDREVPTEGLDRRAQTPPALVGRGEAAPDPAEDVSPLPPPPAPLVLAGRVIEDIWEIPVEGAHVFVCAGDDEGARPAGVTDAEGRFRIRTLLCDSKLEVVANGFLAWHAPIAALPDPKEVDVRLGEGGSVSGIVLDDLGEPVPGFRVHCYREDNRTYWPRTTAWFRSGGRSSGGFDVTNERGAFVIHGLEEGAGYDLGGDKEGWSFLEWGRKEPIRAGERGIEVRTRPLGTLLVRYVDAETERGVSPPEGTMYGCTRNARLYSGRYSHRMPDGRMVVRFGRDVNDTSDPETGVVELITSGCRVYTSERTDVVVRFLETTEVTVPLSPATPGPRFDVFFEACWPDGSPYSGTLYVLAKAGYIEHGHRTHFVDGVAEQPLSLPPETWTFTANGDREEAGRCLWWPASPPVHLAVGRGHDRHVARLQLRGTPYTLTVRNRAGLRVRGYGFSAGAGRRRFGSFRHVPAAADEVVVWLPEGACRADAHLPGVGRVGRVLDVPGDGRPQPLDLVFDEPCAPTPRGPYVPP